MKRRITRETVRSALAALVLLLLVVRTASGFFHTHAVHSQLSSEVSSAVCASCEVESTPITDSCDPINLPASTCAGEVACAADAPNGPCIADEYPLQLRGPPAVSL